MIILTIKFYKKVLNFLHEDSKKDI